MKLPRLFDRVRHLPSFLLLQALATEARKVEALTRQAASAAADSGLLAAELERARKRAADMEKECEYARHRTETATMRANEAIRGATSRNETIRVLEGERDKARHAVRRLTDEANGYRGNAHGVSLKLREALAREEQLREELGTTRNALIGAQTIEKHAREELDQLAQERDRLTERLKNLQINADLLHEQAQTRSGLAREDKRALEAKIAGLVDELKRTISERTAAHADLEVVKTTLDGVWFWQGAGDDPGSLSCPVVMRAATLRKLIAANEATREAAVLVRSLIASAASSGDRVGLRDVTEEEFQRLRRLADEAPTP